MMKRILLAAGASIALATAPAPLAAQDDPSAQEMEQVMSMMGELFPTEPLTPEREARLPLAKGLVALMIPEGAMADMMGKMFDDMLNPIMQMSGSGAELTVAKAIGVTPFELEMSDEQAGEIATLFDPAWAERQEREQNLLPEMMREMMTLMEPGMRKAMSEAFAVRFTDGELTDIAAFFATETGAKYARESFSMASDPRMMAAGLESLPAMMQAFGDMEKRMAESVADLPEIRTYDALSDAERAAVIEATGFSDEEIREALSVPDYSDDSWMEESSEAAEEAAEEY